MIKLRHELKTEDTDCAGHLGAIEAQLAAAVPRPFWRFKNESVSGPSDEGTWAVTDIYFAADGDLNVEEQMKTRRVVQLSRGLLLRFPLGRRLQVNAYAEYSLLGASSGLPNESDREGLPALGFEVVCCRSPHPELFDDMEVAKRFDLGGCLTYVRKLDRTNMSRPLQRLSDIQGRLIEEVTLLSEAEALAATSPGAASWDGVSANLMAGHPDQTPVYLAWRNCRSGTDARLLGAARMLVVGAVRFEEAHAVNGDIAEGSTAEADVAVQLHRLGRSHAFMHAILQFCHSWPQMWFLYGLLALVDVVVALSHRLATATVTLPSRTIGGGRSRRSRRPIMSIAQLDPERLSLVVHSPDRTRLYLRNVLLKGILRWGTTDQLRWFVDCYQSFYDAVSGQRVPLLWRAMEDTTATTFPLVEAVRLGRLGMVELCVAAYPAPTTEDQRAALGYAVDLARQIRDVAAARHPQRGQNTLAHRIAAEVEKCWQLRCPPASLDVVCGTGAAAFDVGDAGGDDISWTEIFTADEGRSVAQLASQPSWGRSDGE